MTTLQEKIGQEWMQAMKARDPAKDTLTLIRTELKNKAINTRQDGNTPTTVADPVAIEVLKKMAKQRRESIAIYKESARPDLLDKETFELGVIERFLPKELGDDELGLIINEVVQEVGASSMKEIGKMMPLIMKRVAGRADGSRIQQLVRKKFE